MEGPLCTSSGAAAGPSSSFNQSRELLEREQSQDFTVEGDLRQHLVKPSHFTDEQSRCTVAQLLDQAKVLVNANAEESRPFAL